MDKSGGGFTILEVMITLAVSAVMLVTAVALFSGQQRKTQFAQSTRDLESKVQDVITDVATGYFPTVGNASCSVSASGPVVVSGGNEQGGNLDCIFLGRGIHFMNDRMEIHTIVGSRVDSLASGATFSTAKPTVVSQLIETYNYQWGLRAYAVHFGNDATDQKNSSSFVVFASTPNGTGSAVGGGLNSGIQRINSYISGVGGSGPISQSSAIATQLNSVLQSASLSWPSSGKVVVCFEDGTVGSPGRLKTGVVISGGSSGISSLLQQPNDGTAQCA